MSWFNNRSVNAKLSIVFGVLTLFLFVLGAGMIWAARDLAQKTQEVYRNNLKPIAILGEIRENIPLTRVLLRDMMLATDSLAVQGFLSQMRGKVAETNANLVQYQPMISSPEEQSAFDELKTTLKIFRDARETIVQLVLENRHPEAKVLLATDCIPKSKQVLLSLQKLVDINASQADNFARTSEASAFIMMIAVVVVCALSLIVVIVGRSVLQRGIALPLLEITQKAQEVERGNINQEVTVRSQDELGKLAVSFNAMVLGIRKGIENLSAEKAGVEAKVIQAVEQSEQARLYLEISAERLLGVMKQFSHGDLRVRVNQEGQSDVIGQIFDGFNQSVTSVETLVHQVISSVQQTSQLTAHISLASKQMAATSQEQSAQITQIASSIEEMARSITENASHAVQVNALTAQAGQNAVKGAEVVQSAVSKIQEIAVVVSDAAQVVEKLGDSSAEIGEIVQVIEEIADQTNLLALNAAIEAARAGDQGRGFAVVADEVRKLAERTAQATKQISLTIKQIQNDTDRAVSSMKRGDSEVKEGLTLAQQAGEALKKIVTGTSEVQTMVKSSALVMEQQSSTADEVAKSIEQMASAVEETTASLTEVADATDNLERSVHEVQSLIGRFEVSSRSSEPYLNQSPHRKQLSPMTR
jgi:methyl-accepting chemotaxis protein